MTIKRVEDLVAKKVAEYPEDPTHNVSGDVRDPVMNRTGKLRVD